MQRRSLLKLGFASAAVLAAAGGVAGWLLQPGLEADGRLSAAGQGVFAAVGQAVLDKTLPAPGPGRAKALTGLLERTDALVQALPPHAQAELSQLLGLLASAPGRHALTGLGQPWGEAGIGEVQLALQAMRLSRVALRQQAYAALHDIATGAYFADAATWPLLGYPGPIKV